MNTEMAYLLGMITGNGEIQRGPNDTTIAIDIPHKKLETEFNNDVGIYVRASITDIRQILEPLIGASLSFIQNKNLTVISFSKPNEDYLIREILGFVGTATSSNNIRISPEVYSFTFDERKMFIKGFADVTAYIRRSNYFFTPGKNRVYFEIPNNWYLVADFANLLKSVDIPVQTIDWAHPNMRDGNLKKYNGGKPDFWKKEHQIKVWANEYEPVGFAIIHKQQALDFFVEEQRALYEAQGKDPRTETHRFYWESMRKDRVKPVHPCENDEFIPIEIRGKHYDSWKGIARDLGYKED